jgi:2'-5' RNA ligase
MPVAADTWSAAAAATAADFAAAGVPTSILGPDRAAAYLTEATNRLVGIGDDIWQAIATQLAQGVDIGESIPELAARIRATAPMTEARATTIARTECLPGDVSVNAANITAIFRRWYEGDWVEIVTASGRKFSGTPNHPMLTRRGWVGLGDLKEGDDLVSYSVNIERTSPAGDHYVEHRPPTLSEIWDAVSAVDVPEWERTAQPDFHGDGMDGYVDVLRPDRMLMYGVQSSLDQGILDDLLPPSHATEAGKSGYGGQFASIIPIDSATRRFSVPDWDAFKSESPLYPVPAHSVSNAEASNGPSRLVFSDDLGRWEVISQAVSESRGVQESASGGPSPNFDSRFSHDLSHSRSVASDDSRNDGGSEPGFVEFDNLVSVGLRQWKGHVYNLTTRQGFFVADEFYTSNTISASNAGSFAQAQTLDDPTMTKTWLATNDPRTRPTHRAADGQTVPLLDAFVVGGFPLMVPGDPIGPPGEIIGCRCSLSYDFDPGVIVAAWDTEVVDTSWSVVLTAAAEPHTGAMVALVPCDFDARRLEVSEPAEELHATLAYLGDDAALTPEHRAAILTTMADFAATRAPLDLDGFAIAVFNPTNPDRDTAVVLELSGENGPELVALREAVTGTLGSILGVHMPDQHTPYFPHVTLAFTDDPTLAGRLTHLTGPILFDRLRVAFGGDVYDFPLGALPADDDVWDVTVASVKNPEFEGKHKRDKEGQFATMAARLGAALKAHTGEGDPFAGFTRDQLRREATKRGIPLSRGESQESISKKLRAHMTDGGDSKTAKPADKPAPKAEAPEPTEPVVSERTEPTPEDIAAFRLEGNVQVAESREAAVALLKDMDRSQLKEFARLTGRGERAANDDSLSDDEVRNRLGIAIRGRHPRSYEGKLAPKAPEPAAPDTPDVTPDAGNERAQAVSDALEDIYVRAANGDITPEQGRAQARKYIDSLKLSAPELRELSTQMGVTVPPRATKAGVRDAIATRMVDAKLQSRAIARDTKPVTPARKPVEPLPAKIPRIAKAPGEPSEAPKKRAPAAPKPAFAGDAEAVKAELKKIRTHHVETRERGGREAAAAFLDSLKLTSPQLRALGRELNIHLPSTARKEDIRDAIVRNQVGAYLESAAITRGGTNERSRTGAPDVPAASPWHGDLTPSQQRVSEIAASPLITRKRQGGAMGVVSLDAHDEGSIVRKDVASRPGSADVRDPLEQADAEQLAPLVAEALGLRAPAVVRTDRHKLEMEFVEGFTGDAEHPMASAPPKQDMRSPDGQRMGILDQAINNYDRNMGNYIRTVDGRLVPIDHSMAFFAGDAAMPRFSTHNLDVTESEAAQMRSQIEALRPEFDRVGRGQWLDETLERFDGIKFAPDPTTPEAAPEPVRNPVDDARVKTIQSRLDELQAAAAPVRAAQLEYTQKYRGGRFAPPAVEEAREEHNAEMRRLKAEAAPLADELLALLRERDGTNLGSVDDPDRSHWDQVRQDFEATSQWSWDRHVSIQPAPSATAAQTAAATKVIDKYREDDRTTVLNNEKLRADDPSAKAWERKTQAAIETTQLSQDSIVYRGAALPPQVLMEFRPGAVISDKGFNSTTSNREIAEGYTSTRSIFTPGVLPVVFEIRTRAGTPAADAQYDGEIVFGAGRSMRIISVSERPAGKYLPAGLEVVAEWL